MLKIQDNIMLLPWIRRLCFIKNIFYYIKSLYLLKIKISRTRDHNPRLGRGSPVQGSKSDYGIVAEIALPTHKTLLQTNVCK